MTGRDLFIYNERSLEPIFSAKVRGKSAAYALLRFGLKRREFSRVLPDLDCGRTVKVKEYTILLNGGAPQHKGI